MRLLMFVLTISSLIGLASWAYQENYKTKQILEKISNIQSSIALAKSRHAMLEAEWAYLNRPQRLQDLAELNFETLGLLPFQADQFGSAEQIAYPPTPLLIVTDAVDAVSRGLTE